MSFCQFVKMYEGKGWQEMRKTNEEGEVEEPDDDKPEEGELAKEDDFNYLIVGNSEAKRSRLPHLLTLEKCNARRAKNPAQTYLPQGNEVFQEKV